jgi:hypothetical protein
VGVRMIADASTSDKTAHWTLQLTSGTHDPFAVTAGWDTPKPAITKHSMIAGVNTAVAVQKARLVIRGAGSGGRPPPASSSLSPSVFAITAAAVTTIDCGGKGRALFLYNSTVDLVNLRVQNCAVDVTTTNDGYKDVKHACGAGTDKNKIPPDLAGGGGGKGSGGGGGARWAVPCAW